MDRFWAKVDQSGGPDACWPWTASRDEKGYGWFHLTHRMRRAHTVAYRLSYGEPPEEHIVRHRCDNKPCCNPRHLVSGTKKDNAQDVCERGDWGNRKGSANGRAYIAEAVVMECRKRYKPYSRTDGVQALAREFGVNQDSLRDAVTRRSWRHI